MTGKSEILMEATRSQVKTFMSHAKTGMGLVKKTVPSQDSYVAVKTCQIHFKSFKKERLSKSRFFLKL